MREIRLSGSEGGGPNPIASPYPYLSCALAGHEKATLRSYPEAPRF